MKGGLKKSKLPNVTMKRSFHEARKNSHASHVQPRMFKPEPLPSTCKLILIKEIRSSVPGPFQKTS